VDVAPAAIEVDDAQTSVIVVAGPAATVMVWESPAVSPALLVAVTVNVDVPAVVGVPDSTPDEAFRLSPAGSWPVDTPNVGAGSPVAAYLYEYAVPAVAVIGGASAVSTGTVTGALMVRLAVPVAVP